MDELIREAREVLHGMWQRRWLGLAVVWIVGLVAALVATALQLLYFVTRIRRQEQR